MTLLLTSCSFHTKLNSTLLDCQDNINTISFILRFNLLQIVSLTSFPPFLTFPFLLFSRVSSPFFYILGNFYSYIKNSAFHHDFRRSQKESKVVKTCFMNLIKINFTFCHIFTKLMLRNFFF